LTGIPALDVLTFSGKMSYILTANYLRSYDHERPIH